MSVTDAWTNWTNSNSRKGQPRAGAVAFLASEDASYITGQTLYVDRGMLGQLSSPQVDTPLPESVGAPWP